jgi:hypothetical protein
MKLHMLISCHDNTPTIRSAYPTEAQVIQAFREELIKDFHFHPEYIAALGDDDLFQMLAETIKETEFVIATFTAHV